MGRTAPRRPGPLPRGGSPAVHGVHHPPRDVHFPERAQHALTAVWPAGQADDEDLEEAEEVGARSGCAEWVHGVGAREGRPSCLPTPDLQAGGTHLIESHLGGTLWGPGHMSRGPHGGPIHCGGKHPQL